MADTFKAAGTVEWKQIADGNTHSGFGIQIDCRQRVYVCISKGAPAKNTEDYMILENGFTREMTRGLAAGDVVSIRTGDPVAIAVRGVRDDR